MVTDRLRSRPGHARPGGPAPVAVARRSGQQASVEQELEEGVLRHRRRDAELGALGDEDGPELGTGPLVVEEPHPAAAVEGVLIVGARERVERVAAVAAQVALLGGRDDEGESPALGEDRAHRVQPGPTVRSRRGEEAQSDTELVEQLPPRFRQIGVESGELAPGLHPARSPSLSPLPPPRGPWPRGRPP